VLVRSGQVKVTGQAASRAQELYDGGEWWWLCVSMASQQVGLASGGWEGRVARVTAVGVQGVGLLCDSL